MMKRGLEISIVALVGVVLLAQLVQAQSDVLFQTSRNPVAPGLSWTDQGGTAKVQGLLMTGSVTLSDDVAVVVKMVAEPPLKKPGSFDGGVKSEGKIVHRLVVDREGESYFGYDMVVESGNWVSGYRVSFRALSNTEQMVREFARGTHLKLMPPAQYPPAQTIHEGDTVELDVLVSADGQQKIVDYVTIPPPPGDPLPAATTATPRDMTVDDERPAVSFDSLSQTAFFINGQKSTAPIGFSKDSGAMLCLIVPDHGRYILALAPHPGFVKAGEIRDNSIFVEDGDQHYELRLAGPIAGAGNAWNLYVKHDPHYWPRSNYAGTVIFGFARRDIVGPSGGPSTPLAWKEFSIGLPASSSYTWIEFKGDGLRSRGIDFETAISFAYGVPKFLIVGPNWLDNYCCDITALVSDPQEFQPLLQRELAKRLGLTVHWESRELFYYTLKLIEGVPHKVPPYIQGQRETFTAAKSLGNQIVHPSTTAGEFVNSLAATIGRPVLDETGLQGRFEFQLTWPTARFTPRDLPLTNSADLIKAVKDQLGMQLVEAKRIIDVLVVDHVEKLAP
jgi:uncharacterized protein (TIGR03435 family)